MSKTISGSNIRIDDAIRAPLIDFEIEGKSAQATSTESTNLCPPPTDGRWVFTGNAYTDASGKLYIPNSASTATYTITWNKRNSSFKVGFNIVSGGNSYLAVNYYDENMTLLGKNGNAQTDKPDGFRFTTTFGSTTPYSTYIQNAKYITITLGISTTYAPNSYSINNIDVTETASVDTHTAYVPNKPSPEYPSSIMCVGYNNLFSGIGADTDGHYLLSDGTVASGNVNLNYTDYIEIPTYAKYVSVSGISSSAVMNTPAMCFYSKNKTFVSGTSYSSATQKMFAIPTTAKYLRTSYRTVYTQFQIEFGTEYHPYIPYGKYGIEVKSLKKNIFNINGNVNYRGNNGTITTKNTVSNGVLTTNCNNTLEHGVGQRFTGMLGKTITFSATVVSFGTGSGGTISIYQDGVGSGVRGTTLNERIFVTKECTSDTVYCSFNTYNGTDAQFSNIQVEVGELSNYSAYSANTKTYSLNEPLRSIGNVKDLLYIKDGTLYLKREIGSQIISSGTFYDGTTWKGYYKTLQGKINASNRGLLCDRAKYVLSTATKTEDTIYENAGNVMFVGTISDTLATLQQKFDGSEVQYVLATPTIEQIGEADVPIVYKGITCINTTDTIAPTMNVTYSNDISEADKTALRNNTAAIKCKLTVLEDGDLPEIILTEENSVKDWEYTDERLVPGQGFIGQFVGRTLDGNLQNINDTFNITDRTINLNIGVYRMNDDVTTWYDYGNFIVTEPEDNEVNDNTKFESMDYTKLFNKTFDGNYIDDNFTTSYNDLMGVNLSEEDKKTFVVTPVTARWVALYTCAQVGIPLATTSFTNSDFEIDINPFQAGESCRDVMKAIGKLALSWVRVGWDNRCYIDFGIESTVDTYDILDKDQYFTLETVEDITPVDGVGFGMQGVDGETAFKIKNNQSVEDAENIIYVYDNPFLYTFEKRTQAVQQASVLFDLTYTQLKTETIGHPWLTGTELINVKNMENLPNYTYAFNKTIKYTGHIRSIINSIDETEVEKTLGYTSSTLKASRNATINVNKQEGTLQMLTSRVEDVEEDVNNVYTKQEINDLIEDATGLTNTYKASGGANKFRNTGLWYRENNGFEYWTGSVSVVSEANSASGTAMVLQQSTLTQTLSNIPNGKYTVSFKFEKTNPTANLQVLINSVDYAEQLVNGKFEQTISVSTNSIELSLICSVANGYKIYELMCNVGEAALVWTQHPDEVRTDTVNISKGITITSSVNNSEIYFKADYDGIRVVNQSDNKTTEFTDDGMITDNATIKKQAKISGALHTIVGSQTWISGIQ